MKIAFAGASGTGKTTLMKQFVAEAADFGVEPIICDVGSREVVRDLGLENPYDVDLVGKRSQFQKLLFQKKKEWEDRYKSEWFITDRTHLDNLTYSIMHDCVNTVDYQFMRDCIEQSKVYDVIVFCEIDRFFHLGTDPMRVKSESYHRVYEQILSGFVHQLALENDKLIIFNAWPKEEDNVEQFRDFLWENDKYINKLSTKIRDTFHNWSGK